jgi:hypothetical protein
MEQCGFNTTDMWNVGLMSEEQPVLRRKLFELMVESGVPQDVFTRMIVRYRTGNERDAVLRRMLKAGVSPDPVSWHVLITGYHKGDEQYAVLLRNLKAGVTLEVSAWNLVIKGYCDSFRTAFMGLVCFARMQQAHVSPDAVTLYTLCDSLVRLANHDAYCTIAQLASMFATSSSTTDEQVSTSHSCFYCFSLYIQHRGYFVILELVFSNLWLQQ